MRTLQWVPRLLALAFSLFLSIFALDAFSGSGPSSKAMLDFAIHLLPGAVVLAIVALAWRREWIGAVAFFSLAIAYILTVPAYPSWIAAIAGPMVAVGALYAWSWARRREGGATR